MARRSFVRGPALRQGQRRETFWAASADESALNALAANTIALDQSFTEALLEDSHPFTIVRTRGSVWVRSDQIAAQEAGSFGISFAVVEEKARAAGAAALNTPLSQEDSDTYFAYAAGLFSTMEDAAGRKAPWFEYSFDSKAMRKVSEGQAIVVVVENASAAGGVEYMLKYRMLFKAH